MKAPTVVVPGIHHYCDRCCHRCPFTACCLEYWDSQAGLDTVAGGPAEAVSASKRSSSRSLDVMRQIADRFGIEIDLAPEHETDGPERLDRDLNDPLVKRSREYAEATSRIVRALAPILYEREDDDLMAALTRIEETHATIAAKIHRAVSGAPPRWTGLSDPQDDANGSAKVARLLIDDARRSWRVLMEAGRAAADGVPARLVSVLDQLDREVAARFPKAMQFVRPGFDE